MRAIITFLLFIILAYFAGALLAYPLKLLLDPVIDLEFRKYLTYATLLSGLLISAIYLYLYKLLSFKGFGFSGNALTFFKTLCRGMIYGIVIMLIIEIILYLLGIHEIDSRRHFSLATLAILFGKALIAGLLIGLIEEAIFRGALFTALYRKTGAVISVTFTSLIYAAVHFIRYRSLPEGTEIDWLTGISMMPDIFRRFIEWSIVDYFLTLFIFGVLLSLLRLKHRNIAGCIGVHAGIVMLIKIADYYTHRTYGGTFDYLVSQYNATFGWISFIVMLIITLFYAAGLARK